jgi:hypothetical protein
MSFLANIMFYVKNLESFENEYMQNNEGLALMFVIPQEFNIDLKFTNSEFRGFRDVKLYMHKLSPSVSAKNFNFMHEPPLLQVYKNNKRLCQIDYPVDEETFL